jgi:SAM-dependent methyltransferase
MRDGYLDLSVEPSAGGSTERTFASFGYEWGTFDEVRDEDEQFARVYFKDLDLGGLEGGVGLDAGCGKGRFTRFLAPHLASIVALDGSSAVEVAARNLSGCPGALVVKADLRSAPLAEEGFDFVSSLGVLHHLDDPYAGFLRLARHLAPGGRMLLYLYSRPERPGGRALGQAGAAALRRLTVRLPHPAVRALAGPVAACLYAGLVLPGRWADRGGPATLRRLPMGAYRGKPFRSLVLDTFDRLSAPVEHRYLWKDLEWWFPSAGMVVDSARDETGWFVLAHKR